MNVTKMSMRVLTCFLFSVLILEKVHIYVYLLWVIWLLISQIITPYFLQHLIQFCQDSRLNLSSKMLLPVDSYTYSSEIWRTTSWLDHCTSDVHDCQRQLWALLSGHNRSSALLCDFKCWKFTCVGLIRNPGLKSTRFFV